MEKRKNTADQPIRWDVETFHRIYQAFFRILVVYAFRILHNEEVARDVVQEAFSYLWEHKVEFPNELVLKAYLYNGVRNNALKYIARHHAEITGKDPYGQDFADLEALEKEDAMAYETLLQVLLERIEALPDRQREVLLMALKGKHAKDIAEALQLSVETVRTHRKRAIAQLRSQLTPDGTSMLLLLLVMS